MSTKIKIEFTFEFDVEAKPVAVQTGFKDGTFRLFTDGFGRIKVVHTETTKTVAYATEVKAVLS